ncbi:MAG: hypothetical protein WD965_00240 [Actinomycetota bacterium]
MDRPGPDEIRRAAKAAFLGIGLGFLLLIVERTRSSSEPGRPKP